MHRHNLPLLAPPCSDPDHVTARTVGVYLSDSKLAAKTLLHLRTVSSAGPSPLSLWVTQKYLPIHTVEAARRTTKRLHGRK
jgi:hypothetical protein